MPEAPARETIFEFQMLGNIGRQNAIDVRTGVEVSLMVPSHCAKHDRERLAARKLTQALQRGGYIPAKDS